MIYFMKAAISKAVQYRVWQVDADVPRHSNVPEEPS